MSNQPQQLTAYIGLFSTFHLLFAESKYGGGILRQAFKERVRKEGVRGKIATWVTEAYANSSDLSPFVIWTIALNETQLGTWRITASLLGIYRIHWFSPAGYEFYQPPGFRSESFELQFETLRQACIVYMKSHKIPLSLMRHPLADVFRT